MKRSIVLYPDYMEQTPALLWMGETKLRFEPPFDKEVNPRLTLDFGEYHPRATGPLHLHTGIDFGHVNGAALLAPCKMVIRSVAWDPGGGGYIIGEIYDDSTPDAVYFRFFHVKEKYVKKGDVVNTGEVIGCIKGNSGINSTGTHLHLEMCYGKRWPRPWRFAVNYRVLCSNYWNEVVRGW